MGMNWSGANADGRLPGRLRDGGFLGEVLDDAGSRVAVSTDNSVYQITPSLVICPRDEADLCRALAVLAEPEFASLPITARGGGTGTNGQSLNTGVVVDLRRHMTRILAVNLAEGWVEVEPGIVLDDLNAELRYTGFFFGPTTSTASRCTIGGMVSTDASGKGSRIYGKTSENVLGLRLALDGGQLLDSGAPAPGWAVPMLEAIASACAAGRDPLLARVPALSRRFTGYDLERALPEGAPFEWWRLPIGAEGTLGIVTRVRLRLVPRPRQSVLVVLAFDSFEHALESASTLLKVEPLAIETLDDVVQRLAERAGLLTSLPASLRGTDSARPVYNVVELAGDDIEEQHTKLMRLLDDLDGLVGYHIARDAAEIAQIWAVRASSVGLLGDSSSRRKPIAFVEDCVVPPERLAAFVREFVAILRRHGLFYGIYGHIDVGCLHVRPALDITEAVDRHLLKTVSDEVYESVKRHGGIFWGEHGKGIRGEYLADFVGSEAYAAFRRIKQAFDPADRFNPGKLVTAGTLRSIEHTPMRSAPTNTEDLFARAFACNGNAACLTVDATQIICPSFKATADPRHSPKGRAEILKAWRMHGGAELEGAAFAALDGCLGCNACANQCPAHISIPELKSQFLVRYFERHRRSLADRVVLGLEYLASTLSRLRPILRLADRLGLSRLGARLLDLHDLPRFASHPRGLREARMHELRAIAATHPETVFLVQDPYTSLFDSAVVATVAEGLARLGYHAVLLPLRPAGKAAHVLGDRRSFRRQAESLAGMLRQVAAIGRPLVGIDPAQTLMFRHEYRAAGISDLPEVLLVQEFLAQRLNAGDRWPAARRQRQATVFLHCSESSALPATSKEWIKVLAAVGVTAQIAPTGCCGMAGLYGHLGRHQDTSRNIFDRSWRPAISTSDAVVTGFSCRCQIDRQTGTSVAHPMQLVLDAL